MELDLYGLFYGFWNWGRLYTEWITGYHLLARSVQRKLHDVSQKCHEKRHHRLRIDKTKGYDMPRLVAAQHTLRAEWAAASIMCKFSRFVRFTFVLFTGLTAVVFCTLLLFPDFFIVSDRNFRVIFQKEQTGQDKKESLKVLVSRYNGEANEDLPEPKSRLPSKREEFAKIAAYDAHLLARGFTIEQVCKTFCVTPRIAWTLNFHEFSCIVIQMFFKQARVTEICSIVSPVEKGFMQTRKEIVNGWISRLVCFFLDTWNISSWKMVAGTKGKFTAVVKCYEQKVLDPHLEAWSIFRTQAYQAFYSQEVSLRLARFLYFYLLPFILNINCYLFILPTEPS